MFFYFIFVGDDESKNEIIFNLDFLCIRFEYLIIEIRRERKIFFIDLNNCF